MSVFCVCEVEAEVEDEVEAEVEAEVEDKICLISCHPPPPFLPEPLSTKNHPPKNYAVLA